MSYVTDLKRVTVPSVRCLFALSLLSLLTIGAFGDSITVDGVHYDEVYIRQSTGLYYICMPDTGHVMNARKTEIDPESVSITQDADARRAILERWKRNRPAAAATMPADEVTDLKYGSVPDVSGKGHDTLLRPSGVSVPFLRGKGERIHDPELEQRIRANLAGSRSGVTRRGGIGSGRASGVAGGAGAGRGGAGGGGAAGGGGGGGGVYFSNISELFSTFNDLEVGEFPNPFSQSGGAGGGQGSGSR